MLSRLISCAFLGLFAATPITRGVVNGPLDDILLHQWDLAPADTDYLKVLEQKRFTEKYGEAGKLYKIKDLKEDRVRRLAVVLPLKIGSGKVIPIPCNVDTGAPGLLYLGSKSLNILDRMNLLKHVYYRDFHYLVNGVLTCGKNEITQVFASDIPRVHESPDVHDDIRCNLLGLEAIMTLEVLKMGIDVD